VCSGQGFHQLIGAVGRTIIHNDNFDIAQDLRPDDSIACRPFARN